MTIGDKIASDFSTDKCHLSDAEQRRLASMIDVMLSKAMRIVGCQIVMDGSAWCAKSPGFINLQESEAGFGDDEYEAITELLGLRVAFE